IRVARLAKARLEKRSRYLSGITWDMTTSCGKRGFSAQRDYIWGLGKWHFAGWPGRMLPGAAPGRRHGGPSLPQLPDLLWIFAATCDAGIFEADAMHPAALAIATIATAGVTRSPRDLQSHEQIKPGKRIQQELGEGIHASPPLCPY